jgi:Ankyrin repeats (3 copies)/Ankyrin repeat
MKSLLTAIVADDRLKVRQLLVKRAVLATLTIDTAQYYEPEISHWLYAGDTALHLAAAGHRSEIAQLLLAAGANANAAGNHRRSAPLHYAADGYVVAPSWNETRQVKTLRALLEAGADAHAQDKNGATPLHRAVRTRCAAAVSCLLDAGSDPTKPNKSGSTAFHLAVQNTGRGGSGEPEAIDGQRRIINEFLDRGITTMLKDGKGKSVLDCANADWVLELLKSRRKLPSG